MIYCSVDLEATGLDPEACDIIEFAAVLDNGGDLGELPLFHTYVLPRHGAFIGEPYALSMRAEAFRRIATQQAPYLYTAPQDLATVFAAWLAKHNLTVPVNVAGKNFGSFDLQFLIAQDSAWKKVFRHRVLDPAILFLEKGDTALPNMSECLKRAGLSGDVAHTATQDALDVITLIRAGLARRGNQ